MLEVEKKVDQQIESMTATMLKYHKQTKINKFKNKIFTTQTQENKIQKKPSSVIPEIGFNNHQKILDYYDYHFKLVGNPEHL